MDQIVAAIQQAALEQQMCNAADMIGLQSHFGVGQPMNLVDGAYGYGRPCSQPIDVDDLDNNEDEDEDEERSRTLFCKNLDERVTEEILYEVFLQAGPIESARIPLDNMGRQRNFGFIIYQHKCAVPFAVELYQGLELFQKKITIRSQCPEKAKQQMTNVQVRNPFSQDFLSPTQPINNTTEMWNARHSMHDGNQFDRVGQKKYNADPRRSDSTIIERNRRRPHQQQQHNNSGGKRRSDQRYKNGRRLI